MLEKIKQVDKNKIILFLSQIFNAIIGVFIGKIIAVYFLPEEFGQYNILLATYTFFFALVLSPYLQYIKNFVNTNDLVNNFSSHFKFFIGANVFAILLVSVILFFFKSLNPYVFGIILLVFPINFMYNFLLDFFNVKGKFSLFAMLSLTFSSVNLLILLFCVFFLKNKVDSLVLLWGIQLAAYFVAAIFFIKRYPFIKFNDWQFIKKAYLKDYIVYAWPLIILAFWNWVNNYFDRYLIEYFLDVKEVGLYNANFSLGAKIFIMLNPFFLTILTPVVFNPEIDLKAKKLKISKYVKIYILIGLSVLVCLYFFHEFLGRMLLSVNYSSGFYIIFWSAFAYFLITFGYLFEIIFYYKKETKIILFANLVSAIVGIVLNFSLIPRLGLNGVLLSLIVSAFIRLGVVLLKYNKTV